MNLNSRPTGRWVAAIVSDVPVRWAQSNRIAIYPASGGTPRMLSMSHDGQPSIIGWTPDGSKLVFSEAKGTATAIYEVAAATGTIKEIKYSNAVISAPSMGVDGTSYAFVIQSSTKPPEVAVIRAGSDQLVQVSRHNTELTKRPSAIPSLNGKAPTAANRGLAHHPVGYQAGTKYPDINIQVVRRVYFSKVYRRSRSHRSRIGSKGSCPAAEPTRLGRLRHRFRRRITRTGAPGYETDDRRRQGHCHGVATRNVSASWLGYGGYMTSAIIKTNVLKPLQQCTCHQPDELQRNCRFPSFLRLLGGAYWESPEVFASTRPGQHHGVSTPTLIQHGEDVRVPISQGYELYRP